MKPGVTLELDKPRILRYGMNALVKIEELTGNAITNLELESIAMKDLRSIIYAGLFHEDPELTPEKVGNLLDDYSELSTVAEKLGEAMTLAFGAGKGKKRGEPKKASGS